LTNSSSQAISIGNTVSGAKTNDIFIGNNIGAIGNSTGNNTYVGSSIGFNANGGGGFYNAVFGKRVFGGYNGFGSSNNVPSYTYAFGYNIFSSTYFDLYNVGIGANIFTNLIGNNNQGSTMNPVLTNRITQCNIGIGMNVCTSISNVNNSIFIGSNTSCTNSITNSVAQGHNTVDSNLYDSIRLKF